MKFIAIFLISLIILIRKYNKSSQSIHNLHCRLKHTDDFMLATREINLNPIYYRLSPNVIQIYSFDFRIGNESSYMNTNAKYAQR